MNIKLKKNLFMAVPLAVLALSFISCGNDGPDMPEDPTPKKVKQVEVMYVYEVSEDMLKVADIEASWADADGKKQTAPLTQTKARANVVYSTFPAKAAISMHMTAKDLTQIGQESFRISAHCVWYAYKATYTDGSTETITNPSSTQGSMTISADRVAEYIAERLNPRLEEISYTINLTDNSTKVEIK